MKLHDMHRRVAFFALATVLVANLVPSPPASAVNGSWWQAGNIMSDAVFTNKRAMSVAQIQSWLDKRLKNCDYWGKQKSELGGGTRAQYGESRGNPAPFTCLNKYYEVPKTSPKKGIPASNYGKSTRPNGSKSAARLIYDAAQAYNISPKVLLVKLGTESAGPLTSDTWPFKSQYTYAMGAHCPDSGPGGSANCDSDYAGFSLQMRESAKLLRWYLDNMTQSWWSYKKPYETNYILWNVKPSDCGGSNVHIRNKATAALYTYTPYQPNQAALDNLYSTGDGCSAYGNRNFWRVYYDWFGRPYTIKYDWLNEPRWMVLSQDLRKHSFSDSQPTGPTLAAGTEVYFSSKTTLNGDLYLRTKHDTLNGADRGVIFSNLDEINLNFVPFSAPRWMVLSRDTFKLDPVTGNLVGSRLTKGKTIYFKTKTTVGGSSFARSHHDTIHSNETSFKFNALSDTAITHMPMNTPRWFEYKKATSAIDTTDGTSSGEVRYKGFREYFTHKFSINGVTYLMQQQPTNQSEYYIGVPLTSLKTVDDGFMPFINPRALRVSTPTQKINTHTEETTGGVIGAGRVIEFTSKIYIDNELYVRTSHDSSHGFYRAIPFSDLEEL